MKKKTNIKTVIRKIVREEVAMAIQEVITELKQPTQQVSQPQPRKKIVEKKQFTKNSILNDVLNETVADEEWKTMGGGTYDSSKMNDLVKSNMGITQNDIAADTAIAAGVNPNSVPKHLEKALTKDYRSLLKATEAKAKQKRNI